MTIIQKGFRVTVTSWENDGDYYNTKSKEGMGRPEVEFELAVLRAYAERFGNECDREDGDVEACADELKAVFEKHGKPAPEVLEWHDDESEAYLDAASDIAYDYMGGSEHYVCRVLDSFTVEFIPADVVLEDVTKEFE